MNKEEVEFKEGVLRFMNALIIAGFVILALMVLLFHDSLPRL